MPHGGMTDEDVDLRRGDERPELQTRILCAAVGQRGSVIIARHKLLPTLLEGSDGAIKRHS